jgi:uncharacterized membrane protein YhaH (DUF805 family)
VSSVKPEPINPYRAPTAAVADAGDAMQPVRLFSASGRIGRARYIAYGFGLYLLSMLAGVVGARLFGEVGAVLATVAWVAMAVLGVMLTVQRCHDFNVTGWLALLIVVPLANLVFLFIPGTDGPNRFGAPTPPNSVGVLVVAWLIPGIVIAGMIAAIALPAYQAYLQR